MSLFLQTEVFEIKNEDGIFFVMFWFTFSVISDYFETFPYETNDLSSCEGCIAQQIQQWLMRL